MGKRNRQEQEEHRVKLETALANPVRADILAILNEGPSDSPSLAKALDEPRGTVAYHLRVLLKLECIEEIGTVPVRGVEKKIYIATEKMYIGPDTWQELPLAVRSGMSLNVVRETNERAQAAFAEGTFDKRKNRIAGNWAINLDEEGWQEAFALLAPVIERFEEMEEEAVERTPDIKKRSPFTFTVLAYESPRKGNGGRTKHNPPHGGEPAS